MIEVCRLCAKAKQLEDFQTTIDDDTLDMKQKLKDCCRWNWIKHNDQLPKTVCKICYRKLLNSWAFCESVASAQMKLLQSFQTNVTADNEEFQKGTMESLQSLKTEDTTNDEEFPGETMETSEYVELQLYPSKIFDNSVPSISKRTSKDSNTVVKHKVGVEKKRANPLILDTFLKLLSANDCNANGTIKPEKINKLKLNDWSIFPHKCWKCGDFLKNHYELRAHITANHPNEQPNYICSLCSDDRVYSKCQRGFLSTHVSENHIPHLNYCCFKCNTFFWDKNKLRNHIQHHNDKLSPSTCKICGNVFTLKASFQKHQQTHLPQELKTLYECCICKGTYVTKHSLQLHMKIHLITKEDFEFRCEQCGKGFLLKNGLQSHMVSHRTERQSTCDVCGKNFKTSRAVKVHQMTHSNEKKFKCNECDQQFKRLGTLRRHKLIHTDELPHPCNTCGKRFRRKTMLTVHMRTHTGDRPFHCSVCDYRSIDWSNCHKHMKVKHGMSMSNRSQMIQGITNPVQH